VRAKSDVVKLFLAGRISQTPALMNRAARADVAQYGRGSQVGSGRQGTADSSCYVRVGRGRCCAGSQTHSS
jgi:hypothetical protein